MTKIFLLRKIGNIYEFGDTAVHYEGVPFRGKDKDNIDKARTFKSEAAARSTTAAKHLGYEVVPATVTIELGSS